MQRSINKKYVNQNGVFLAKRGKWGKEGVPKHLNGSSGVPVSWWCVANRPRFNPTWPIAEGLSSMESNRHTKASVVSRSSPKCWHSRKVKGPFKSVQCKKKQGSGEECEWPNINATAPEKLKQTNLHSLVVNLAFIFLHWWVGLGGYLGSRGSWPCSTSSAGKDPAWFLFSAYHIPFTSFQPSQWISLLLISPKNKNQSPQGQRAYRFLFSIIVLVPIA